MIFDLVVVKAGNGCPATSVAGVCFGCWLDCCVVVLCGMGGKAPGTGTIAQAVSSALKRCCLCKLPMLTILERKLSNRVQLKVFGRIH